MPVRLEFQGWGQPALPRAVDWLIGQYGSEQLVDMDHVVVVVPGSRAGRRLRRSCWPASKSGNCLVFRPGSSPLANFLNFCISRDWHWPENWSSSWRGPGRVPVGTPGRRAGDRGPAGRRR